MMEDTIAAISTPLGEGGIGIVRVSGPGAIEAVKNVFIPRQSKDLSKVPSFTLHYGKIVDPADGKIVDEVLVSVMRAPKSYTGEDVVEINCHGGIVAVEKVLELILKQGIRLAEPGEFTKRAFLNGRIDLSQAEAVIDIIRAKTEASLKLAGRQLSGELREKINAVRQKIINILAFIEVSIDYPEYEFDEVTPETALKNIDEIINDVRRLLSSYERGRILREGITAVIAGKPNVGKSSLLNALLRKKRAIVTDIPGTTRDVIEDYLNLKGIPVKIVDTAGIRETEDLVEKLGVEKTREYLNQADVTLFVVDVSIGIDEDDEKILSLINKDKSLLVINKIDLLQGKVNFEQYAVKTGIKNFVPFSARNFEGLEILENKLYEILIPEQEGEGESALISNLRHKNYLEKALNSLLSAKESIASGEPVDLVAIDLNEALRELGAITGDALGDEIINEIFSQFCVGK
ncbi:tRNA uridine-5-carboxymethylaminomethyl(34) synthesis GTPase MnmE [Carboxydothermus hydrogenoformans]|uniref:tRNA modification GTPase MnmE n=1 Tax=Carboxydothermus hydrogenoformans (strain ATCC BAA-161 / DSM 6008 / Z-2901) TaxID=246194 RepID=MNME_CARHZ|nr:tRNA uridine-5-carboxymethylaminomethyl(34) synthesis GTPase MnmE [Carboxydothermus hydrogenoformans]Q3AG56.1 RecName: Full=tRNA modification GTPase MnmE [Carboxydothermus hydrogenoformans Z-2901]ABB15607.1 tRNA modification GTPase TrmE [Carboxydothermus hydrogenoformans Z-2901]